MSLLDALKNLVGMKKWDYSDRRDRLRLKCRIEASLQRETSLIGVEIRDISVTGLQLMCLGKVKKGEIAELRGIKLYNQAEHNSVKVKVEWCHKQSPGWLAGISFVDEPAKMSKSWLLYELKSQGLKAVATKQKRESVRVKCRIPAKLFAPGQSLRARIRDIGVTGARVESEGNMLEQGTLVKLRFGPIEKLPQVGITAMIAGVHKEGSPIYGLKFSGYETGSQKELEQYLDFFSSSD